MPIIEILSTDLRGTVPTVGTIQILYIPAAWSEDYIHCDGTQLRLTDSDFGPGQNTTSDYIMCGLLG